MSRDKKRCGNCIYWMLMPQCPREYPIKGGHRGPNMDALPCEKFKSKENNDGVQRND
jgi:hypothetical protein